LSQVDFVAEYAMVENWETRGISACPKPVPLGPRAVGWLESDVSERIAGRVKIARAGGRLAS